MRSVLYTYDFEPITVINLKPWHIQYLDCNGRVILAVMPPLPLIRVGNDDCFSPTSIHQVTIIREIVRIRGQDRMLLFTRQEEIAILLDSCFLPGQIAELKDRERDAFARGVMAAFDALRDDQ